MKKSFLIFIISLATLPLTAQAARSPYNYVIPNSVTCPDGSESTSSGRLYYRASSVGEQNSDYWETVFVSSSLEVRCGRGQTRQNMEALIAATPANFDNICKVLMEDDTSVLADYEEAIFVPPYAYNSFLEADVNGDLFLSDLTADSHSEFVFLNRIICTGQLY